jgi:uncharacterized iron-regulated protein
MRLLLPLLLVTGLALAGCATERPHLHISSPYQDPATLEKGQILHLATGRLLTEGELMSYLSQHPIVYVGETHDNVEAHAVELAVLEGLHQRFPGEVALGLEMLQRPAQPDVDAYIRGDMDEKSFLRVWQKNWNPSSFPYYRDILRFARENSIPVLALNASRELKGAVREHGLDGLPPEVAQELPEMDLDDPYHRAVIDGILAGHPHMKANFDQAYRIQVLWDETMAQTVAEYLESEEGSGKHLVVFAGGNHFRYGIGIPRRVFRRVPLAYAILETYPLETPVEKQMEVELPPMPMRPADLYWAIGYRDLKGQQVMLGVQIELAEDGGARVLGVVPSSPAEQAGIQVEDVIVSVDGKPIEELFDLTYQVGLHQPGDVGPVEVLRGEERQTLQVTYDVVRHGE